MTETVMQAYRYHWLANLGANSFSLSHNDHASNYVTAKKWIEEYVPEWFSEVPSDLLAAMKEQNSIWCLHMYPRSPVSFYVWYGPTLDAVVEQAMAQVAKGLE